MKVVENSKYKISNGAYLWKYIDFYKLGHFLETKALYFTRLDLFEDPLEGLSAEGLRNRYLLRAVPDDEDRNPRISLQDYEALKQEMVSRNIVTDLEREGMKQRFASCWFLSESESLAMWNLYSDSGGLAIRFPANALIDTVSKAAMYIEDSCWPQLILGKVIYVDISEIKKQRFLGFRKVRAYEHEKEFRFMTVCASNELKDSFELKLGDIQTLRFDLVSHPLMEKWKQKVLKKMLNNYHVADRLTPSSIILT